MGNAQSHAYAERQRDIWIRNSPHHNPGSDALRRTRSPTDGFMPEYGYKPCPREGQMQRAASTLSGPIVSSFDDVHELKGRHSPKLSDTRRMEGPTPACMSRTPAQAEALKCQSEDHVGHSTPPPPARNASDGHVHFEITQMEGIREHDHAHARPRTPYPKFGNNS